MLQRRKMKYSCYYPRYNRGSFTLFDSDTGINSTNILLFSKSYIKHKALLNITISNRKSLISRLALESVTAAQKRETHLLLNF